MASGTPSALTGTTPNQVRKPAGRVHFFDALRGFCVISMVLFHACYDLVALKGIALGVFEPPFVDIWRASIAWTFLVISGWMCSFSKNNVLRALRYLAVALGIFLVTSVAAVDDPISFGIIFCIGGSTLADGLLERAHVEPKGVWTAAVLFALFLVTRHAAQGYLGFEALHLELPAWLYATNWFSWLGFPGPGFISGDYYPLIPFTFMYGVGTALGRAMKGRAYPAWLLEFRAPALEWVGRHALIIYVVHQPLLLVLLGLA